MSLIHQNFSQDLLRIATALAAILPIGVSAQHTDNTVTEMLTNPHAGHAVPQQADLPREPIPPLTQADRAAAFPDVERHAVHDKSIHHYTLLNRLEAWNNSPGSGFAWEAQSWIGNDLNRLWIRSEGERIDEKTESADLELLYGRAAARWWDVVVGLRHDFEPGGDAQTFAAIGVIGLAPYKFEVSATAYAGEAGQTAARLKTEYDMLLTNRMILQPAAEVTLFGQDDVTQGIGSGLSSIEAGLRLRYEINREFAPYIGVNWKKNFGQTADFARANGDQVSDAQFVIGLRTWF